MRTTRATLAATAAIGIAACGGAAADRSAPADRRASEAAPDASAPIDAASESSPDATDATGAPLDAGAHDDASDAADATPDARDAGLGRLGFDCTTDAADAGGVPGDLACTGLYASWPDKRIAPDARPFTPAVALWSDGAEKSRFIYLPPRSRIDTTSMNEWIFPVGTKLWKEFRLNGVRVETRFLWKRGDGDWVRTTYAWSADQSSARQLTTGALGVMGTPYEIPTQEACTTCHQGRIDGVLGFEVIGLSLPGAQGLTMAALASEGRVTNAPAPIAIPGNATESAALLWLHANCGTACHNRSPSSFAGATGLFLRLDVERLATTASTDTYATAVNVVSGFQPYAGAGLLRIAPGAPSRSAIAFRVSTRDTQGEGFQMPPVDSHVVDTANAQLIASWISAMR